VGNKVRTQLRTGLSGERTQGGLELATSRSYAEKKEKDCRSHRRKAKQDAPTIGIIAKYRTGGGTPYHR